MRLRGQCEPLPVNQNCQWKPAFSRDEVFYNNPMASQIPATIRGQKYISLKTFRKNGAVVATPVWFGEENEKLYVMTRSISGKYKRIRNNPSVRLAPCNIRGVVTGAESAAVARLLPMQDHAQARATINRKYWAAWITSWFSRADVFIELNFE
jgi:hypothetical protein